MIAKVPTAILLLLSNSVSFSQVNLVPNPGFEQFDTCPTQYGGTNTGLDQICRAVPWFQPYYFNPSTCGGSSDFYHICAGSVPINFGGFQNPKSGNGYAAISPFQNSSDLWREYMEVKLTSQLIATKNYCVSWYTSLSNYISRYGCNRIGVYFSIDTLFQTGSYDYINVTPHVENLEIITDTSSWVLFKQIYASQGFEQFMTVGNFRQGVLTDTSNVINPSGWAVYYYFDDFSVYQLPDIDAGNDDTICTLGGSVQLQATCTSCWAGLKYRWWPTNGLNDTTILNPTASPSQTTTYYFGLIDTSGTVPCMVDYFDSVTVHICDSLSAMLLYNEISFDLYPNPSNTNVTLLLLNVLSEDADVRIYNIAGQQVLATKIFKDSKKISIDISALPNAIYVIHLHTSNTNLRKKFIKM